MNEEQITARSFPGGENVTVLVYDLPGNTNPEANTKIMDSLKRNGWQDTIPQALIRMFNRRDCYGTEETMPSTTLWKAECTPEIALELFETLVTAYNSNPDRKGDRIQGKAVAFSVGQYSALLKL